MKILTKMSLLTITATILAASGAFAETDYVVKRIDHPNGQPNFVRVPVEPQPTIAIFVEGRSFGQPVVVDQYRVLAPRDRDVFVRPIPIQRGRGETLYVTGEELR